MLIIFFAAKDGEALYSQKKNKTGSWLWLRYWTPYCQIQTSIEVPHSSALSHKYLEPLREVHLKFVLPSSRLAASWVTKPFLWEETWCLSLWFAACPTNETGAGDASGKDPAYHCRRPSSILRSGRSPGGGHDNPLQYSHLENPHGQWSLVARVHGVAKSQTGLSNSAHGTSLVAQLLRICFRIQGMWVWFLVRELRSHMPWSN